MKRGMKSYQFVCFKVIPRSQCLKKQLDSNSQRSVVIIRNTQTTCCNCFLYRRFASDSKNWCLTLQNHAKDFSLIQFNANQRSNIYQLFLKGRNSPYIKITSSTCLLGIRVQFFFACIQQRIYRLSSLIRKFNKVKSEI